MFKHTLRFILYVATNCVHHFLTPVQSRLVNWSCTRKAHRNYDINGLCFSPAFQIAADYSISFVHFKI